MSDDRGLKNLQLWLAGLVGGIVSGVVVAGVMLWSNTSPTSNPSETARSNPAQPTPALAQLDAIRCPRGLTRSVQIRGVEDNFSRLGEEPARIEPSLLRFGSFRDAQDGKIRALGLRSYDEGGTDKQLIDYFDVPQDAVSGTLIFKFQSISDGSANDYIRLIPSATFKAGSGAEKLASFSTGVADALSTSLKNGSNGVVAIGLDKFVDAHQAGGPSEVAAVLNYLAQQAPNKRQMTVLISDDTAVDMIALSLCSEPDTIQGVTFVESSDKPLGPDLSILSCATDDTQSHCGPYSGDTACSTLLPMACYKDGANPKPSGLTAARINDAAFVGGVVRPSKPVAATDFPTRLDADAFCAAEFGAGFRVLSYQEGGGAIVVSSSQIPARMRLWIDIRDQPRGRCWDRPGSGIPAQSN